MGSSHMRGVFLDVGSITKSDIDMVPLGSLPVAWAYYDHTPTSKLIERIAEAEVIITNKVVLDGPALKASRKLKLICVAATGTNNVDLEAARLRGITVCNVRGYATPSVVEHVFGLMLALMRHFPEYQNAVREGHWQHSKHFSLLSYPIFELNGKTLGIVGYGELGQAVARVADAFGMNVLIAERAGSDSRTGRVSLAELLPRVDVLSLHVPLTDETRGLIGETELLTMRRGAILINTARGGIVDEEALAKVLRSGHLGGAGVDVLTREPPSDNPLLAVDIPNLILTPHIAWASRESRQRLLNEVTENIHDFLQGRPRDVVT